jgi:uncharacterized protein YjbJ (UPF0337 family)
MSTERNNESHTATEQRYATGKSARDEQTATELRGFKGLIENWTEAKGELRRKYGQLTEQDLDLKPGKEQETIDRVGKRLNKTPQEARNLVQEVVDRFQKKPGDRAYTGTPTDQERKHKP